MTSTARRLVIEQILFSDAGEHWFTDGHPTWREGPNDNRPSMSKGEAQAQRQSDVKMLHRHCKTNSRGLRLADVIESCKPGDRCLSAACIECNRATQRLFVDAGEALLRSSSVSVTAMSVVFRGAWILQGRLINPSDLFESLSRRLRKALLVAGIRQAFGGFDISANEHASGGFPIRLIIPGVLSLRANGLLDRTKLSQRDRGRDRRAGSAAAPNRNRYSREARNYRVKDAQCGYSAIAATCRSFGGRL